MVNTYGQWFIDQGIVPNDLVALYLHNSPEFVFAWLGLTSIGAAPAMINYNLAGKALEHSLKTSKAKLLLVDEDPAFQARIRDVMSSAEDKDVLLMKAIILDSAAKTGMKQQPSKRPEDWRREAVQADWPFAIFYTSGTTGMPKACAFKIDRFYPMAAAVRSPGHPLPFKCPLE
jgi:acyl-coenzyme A synthetase/AMP-(fatty) acid ligase